MTSVAPVLRRSLRAAAGAPALSLMGSMLGFGAFTHGAGWTLFETMLSTVVIWALPAQVILVGALAGGSSVVAALAAVSISSIRLLPMTCSVMPVLRTDKTSLWTQVLASHFVAQTLWVLSFLNLPKLEREERLPFYFVTAALLVSSSTVFCAIGWLAASELPLPLAVALLMLTPVSFLLLTEKAARRPEEKLAMTLGLVLLPVVHELAPLVGLGDWDLLITGLVGGTVAFAYGNLGDRRAAA